MRKTFCIIPFLSALLLASCGGKDDPVTPADVPVTGITLSAESLALETGRQATLTAKVSPSDATDPSVAWSSSAEGVATVKDGLVTAVSAGEATITATAGERSATCRVTVTDPVPPYIEVTSVALDRKSRLLPLGGSFSLTATVLPSDATEPAVTWSSSDEAVATVSEGVVTAVSEGTASIVATASGRKAACLVSVVPEGPSGREIWYVSWTSAALKFGDDTGTGANIVSNTYENGKGVIVFDGDVTAIPSSLFQGSSGLRNIWLPGTVKEIAYQAFSGCSTLLNIYLQEGLKVIGSDAFRNCSSLRKLALPSTLETLGQSVIRGDNMLPQLVIPESIVSLGDYALYGSTGLTSISFLADTPPTLGFRALDETNDCPVYIPSSSMDKYKTAPRWKDYAARLKQEE